MSQSSRIGAIVDGLKKAPRQVDWPATGNRHSFPSEIFGSNVFPLETLQGTIPRAVFDRFIGQLSGHQPIDKATANAVAEQVCAWAMERGATHFTHWFQPQTGLTAEKHDNFLDLKQNNNLGIDQWKALDRFSGSQLIQSEPDASSFPTGGMRSTFEARGYTIWDTSSPMFLKTGPYGTKVLIIPAVFIGYNGEALDEKTILLRSSDSLSVAATKLLHLLGDVDVKNVYTTLGTEQEYFLIDRQTYQLRPDLKIAGRTLIGTVPPKHQQLEDHYFGAIPSRVLATMAETELELHKLGVPVKTRHNEVAPNQFELAPIFEESSIAIDHNLLTMETLHQVAHRHGLKVLFHEKPFKGVNGSGKHCNWSMATSTGINLLDPTLKPETNYRFLIFLVAVLNAVYKHGGLLRCGIASASNEHRLGANEAPPGIVSAFLGAHLSEVLDAIEEGRPVNMATQPHTSVVKVGGTVLNLSISSVPEIARDLTDRNRTSPFAFTGNKFEFRAVGSKQSPSFPMTLLNAAVAQSIFDIADALNKQKGTKAVASTEDILAVVRRYIKSTKAIRFEGNGYSQEWVVEAEKRGLPNIKACPVAFRQLLDPQHSKLLTGLGILTEAEIKSRYHILMEKYVKDLVIEGNTLKNMVAQGVLPAAFAYRKELSTTVANLKTAGLVIATAPEVRIIDQVATLANELQASQDKLVTLLEKINAEEDTEHQAELCSQLLTSLMEEIRTKVDSLEMIVSDSVWPYPKYAELLF
ncbi:glutamine synthetase [Synchytrium endobioticum]|uniref:Glutamine synthetase n=1 Tax=Synchytrium endobioticum TaxID=286115 RepID=A0A507CFB7_9FUNG|nr:glutamine synthetase [Synchytrium endobioticum]TPX40210.1 glutamine synthetase [Synchytrium endobioticum]